MMQVCFQELTQSIAGQHVLGYLYDAADHGRAKARFQRAIEDLCMLSLIEKVRMHVTYEMNAHVCHVGNLCKLSGGCNVCNGPSSIFLHPTTHHSETCICTLHPGTLAPCNS